MQILIKNCSFVPKNVHLVLKNQKNCTFYTETDVFAKQFHWNVQILDKNCSFTFYAKNEVFEKKKFTKMYKFWIKKLVLYQKCIFGPEKTKNFYFLL